MAILNYLWLFPFFIHAGYFLATIVQFENYVGTADGTAITISGFVIEWIITLLFLNFVLLIIRSNLHKFKDSFFQVPQKEYWLSNSTNKNQLTNYFKTLFSILLIYTNVLFLGMYQYIYQTNTLQPVVEQSPTLLMIIFFVAPSFLIISALLFLMLILKKRPKAV